jgi:2-polyprenyl-3-methyl-5-hydroxy-6-metoxy-1,4-benzoquinol methylase
MGRSGEAAGPSPCYKGLNEEDSMTTGAPEPAKVEEMTDRTVNYLSGAAVAALTYLGDQLGLYRALHEAGRVTSAELASRSGLHERWVREWLHGQASAGLVRYAGGGLFELTAEQAAVLADETNPAFAAGGFALLFPLFGRWDRLRESFRTGRGVPYDELGVEHAVGEARFSGPWMRANLVPVIIAGLEGVQAKLVAGAKVADIGCGSGAALLEMAKAYPSSEFHGYDSSELAIRFGEERCARSGLANVTFHRAAAETLRLTATFDFILTWDCLHDMTDPAGTMRAIRAAIKPDGTWLIVDINGRPIPEENYDQPLAGLLYAFSVLDCLSCSTSAEGGAGLGTLGFPEPVARKMIAEAGFKRFAARDFGNPLNAFYEVRP